MGKGTGEPAQCSPGLRYSWDWQSGGLPDFLPVSFSTKPRYERGARMKLRQKHVARLGGYGHWSKPAGYLLASAAHSRRDGVPAAMRPDPLVPNARHARIAVHRVASTKLTALYRSLSYSEFTTRGLKSQSVRKDVLLRRRVYPIPGRAESEKVTPVVITSVAEDFRGAARPTGPIQFVDKLLKTWRLTSEDAVWLLGRDREYVRKLLRGSARLAGRDIKDRIAYLFRIRQTLSSLFRDEDTENAWLREPHELLNEKTPLQLLQEGSMEGMLTVKEYVDAAAGR